MDHTLAQQTKIIDKYLLDELSHEERSAFEEHMFDCPACAARVKNDFAMVSGLKAVLAEPRPLRADLPVKAAGRWREWFRPITLVPAFASLALAFVVSYQNMVSIPAMLRPQLLETTPFVSATRGASTQTAVVKPGAAQFLAAFDVAAPMAYPAYVCEFRAEGKGQIANMNCGKHATAEFTLNILLPSTKFPPGGYTMILRPASDLHAEVSRYSFAVKNESQ